MPHELAGPVADVFAAFAPAQRRPLLALRDLVLELSDHPAVGEIEESLKCGEPAYRPRRETNGHHCAARGFAEITGRVRDIRQLQNEFVGNLSRPVSGRLQI